LQVRRLDGKCQTFAFFHALFLKGSRGAERGIEGDVVLLFAGRTRLDVTSVFALGLGERTSACVFACEFIERRVQLARLKLLASLDLLSAFPPIRICVSKHILRHGLGLALLRTLVTLIFEF
jgi:hypothetical protein